MNRRTAGLIAAALVVFFGAIFVAHHRPKPKPHPSPSPSAAVQCDSALLSHVYHPARLAVIAPCRTYSGVIEFDRTEPDGDHHVLIKPDDPAAVNSVNVSQQHGDLVIEPICQGLVTQQDAQSACQGFHSNIAIPPIGTHVAVTGQYVTDTQHGGWAEIHPVTSIVTVGKLGSEQVQPGLTDWVDEPESDQKN